MIRIINFALLLALSLTVLSLSPAYAGGYSLREASIRADIPPEYRSHTNGIVAAPTDAEVQAAIAFGMASKDKPALDYAYIVKAPHNLFASDNIYVRVATPLCLIANHAKDQAQEYRKVDDAFVQYARGLRAVRISLTQQFVNAATLTAYGFQRQPILLRDGVRVESLSEIQGWRGANPFADKPDKKLQAAFAKASEALAQTMRAQYAAMAPEQRELALRGWQNSGMTEDQIMSFSGLSREEVRKALKTDASNSSGKLPLTELDAVFPLDELIKPGKYEIVFRTPPTASLIASGDKEVRFPISFDHFR